MGAEQNISLTIEQAMAGIVRVTNCPYIDRLGFHPGAKGHQGELEEEGRDMSEK